MTNNADTYQPKHQKKPTKKISTAHDQNSKINETPDIKQIKVGKLLDRLKIKVSDQEFKIEIYNNDFSNEDLKKYSVLVNGTQYIVEVESLGTEESTANAHIKSNAYTTTRPTGLISQPSSSPSLASTTRPGLSTTASTATEPVQQAVNASSAAVVSPSMKDEDKILTAPMPGKILEIKTKVDDKVEAGQELVILEAMKMENVMTAPASGIVKEIPINVGDNVTQADVLVIIK